MITDEVEVKEGDVLLDIDTPATAIYLVVSGGFDLHYIVVDDFNHQLRKDFIVGNINPGELLGISGVIEPYTYTATAIAIEDGHLLKIDAKSLRTLAEEDSVLGCGLQRQVAKVAMERLHTTRVQLAAAIAPE
jgi:CRP-like cAMP-binding protein